MISRHMATAHPLPVQATAPPRKPESTGTGQTTGIQSLAPVVPQPEEKDLIQLGAPLALLPIELDVCVPVNEFRVRGLLALEPGQVIESQWIHGEDVPLASGKVQLAWTEFEVVDAQLAVRITRLA